MKFSLSISLFLLAVSCSVSSSDDAKGIVFHDVDGNGKFNEGDKPLPSIKVSNGKTIVKTNWAGRYNLPVDDDTIIFVIKPKGWQAPLSKNKLPQFYYVHKPKGSRPDLLHKGVAPTGPLPESVDFALYPNKEPDQFRALLFGDPQPRNQKEIDYIAHDVVEELIGTDASFGVTLGDIMFDDLKLFGSLNSAIALIGIPWYNVIGNHDINFDAKNDKESDETFERVYGPSYYSFDYGSVHFLVLDDIEWYVPEGAEKGRYRGGLGKTQLEFIKKDLSLIPEEQLVVLLMHIPIVGVEDRHELYRLIEKRPFCMSVSGHTHHHEHRFVKKEDGWMGAKRHHHVINVTVSGSWWSGQTDELGIPHTMMSDGAPNGYSIISFDGNKYSLSFKAARKPKDYQMRIVAPESIAKAEVPKTTIYVNVFNGSEHTKVKMQVARSKKWINMKRSVEHDPAFIAVKAKETAIPSPTFLKLPNPKPCPHLWKVNLPELDPGTHLIQIQATLADGREFIGKRTIRVTE